MKPDSEILAEAEALPHVVKALEVERRVRGQKVKSPVIWILVEFDDSPDPEWRALASLRKGKRRAKKWTNQTIDALLVDGVQRISDVGHGADPIEIECRCGEVISRAPFALAGAPNPGLCLSCTQIERWENSDRRWTEERFAEEQPGFTLLEPLQGARTPVWMRCDTCGHERRSTPRGAHHCPVCHGRTPWTNDRFDAAAEGVAVRLGDVTSGNAYVPVRWIECGHENSASGYALENDLTSCRECSPYRPVTAEEAIGRLAERDYELLEPYRKALEPHRMKCPNGHIIEKRPVGVWLDKSGCGVCYSEAPRPPRKPDAKSPPGHITFTLLGRDFERASAPAFFYVFSWMEPDGRLLSKVGIGQEDRLAHHRGRERTEVLRLPVNYLTALDIEKAALDRFPQAKSEAYEGAGWTEIIGPDLEELLSFLAEIPALYRPLDAWLDRWLDLAADDYEKTAA